MLSPTAWPEPSAPTPSAPEPSAPEPSAPEPSGTSPRYLHRNLPEPDLSICTETFCTFRNLARNLVLDLHRIAPELIWAKDPIAKCCCWGKNVKHVWISSQTIVEDKKQTYIFLRLIRFMMLGLWCGYHRIQAGLSPAARHGEERVSCRSLNCHQTRRRYLEQRAPNGQDPRIGLLVCLLLQLASFLVINMCAINWLCSILQQFLLCPKTPKTGLGWP